MQLETLSRKSTLRYGKEPCPPQREGPERNDQMNGCRGSKQMTGGRPEPWRSLSDPEGTQRILSFSRTAR